MQGALRTFGDLGTLEVWTLSETIMCRPCGQKDSIDPRNVGLSLKMQCSQDLRGPLGAQTPSENRVRVWWILIMSSPIPSIPS